MILKDILLTESGDLAVTSSGDISLTDSVCQAIKIRLLWFLGEWRLGTSLGLPWFEEILIKNPNKLRIEQVLRDEILSVDEVTDVKSISCRVDAEQRAAFINYVVCVGDEVLRGEVIING